jgi:hypothetical protein
VSPTYAAQTVVSPEKSRNEIEATLKRFGADQFMYGYDQEKAMVRFRAHGKLVSFVLPLPETHDRRFTHSGYQMRTEKQRQAAYDQTIRQRWRALALVIKAKLEAVESAITTFEDEFMAHLLLPDGQTIGEWIAPQMAAIYERDEMPKLLPAGRIA